MPGPPSNRVCPACGSPVAHDARYCIACGERQVELPARVRELLGRQAPVAPPFAEAQVAVAAPSTTGFRLPKPRDMAIAVLAVLGFGVVVGTAVSPAAQPAAPPYTIALMPAPAPPPPVAVDPPETTAPDVPAPPVPETVVAAAPPAAPAPAPAPAKAPKAPAPPPTPTAPTLPPVKHVFLIVLADQGFNQAFGPTSTSTYLAKTLTPKGELVTNYYAVAQGNLANANALISGQGPTLSTTQNCPAFTDIAPGTVDGDGQVIGDGCLYPRTTQTIADELVAGGHSWKAYVQGMGTAPDGTPATCRTPPAPDAPPVDPATAATAPPDPYAAWRNPFVYFHSITDTPLCAQSDVGIEQLAADLKTPSTTPSLSYIVPDLCHNGSDTPCAPGQPAGLPPADAFLEQVVPQIMDSAAYEDGGLIAITFDQAPQTGEHADSSSCCQTPAYPNLPAVAATPPAAPPPADPIAPIPTDPTATTPTDPASTTPTDPPPDPAAAPAPTAVAAQFGEGTTPAPSTTTTPTAPVDPGLPTSPTGGGGHVGLLLLSPYVKPATTSAFGYYNHFSLLKSIEALFGVGELGYTKDPTLQAFDATVYTNPTGEVTPADG